MIIPSTLSPSLFSPSSNPLYISSTSGVDLTRGYGTLKTDSKPNPDFLSHLSKGKKDDILEADSTTFKSPDSTSVDEDVIVSCEKPFDKSYYISVDFEMPGKDHVNAFQILITDNADLQITYTTGTGDDLQVKNFILSPDPIEISQNINDLTELGIIADSGSSLEFIKKLKDIGFVDQEANRGTFFILLDEKPIDESENILRFSFDQLEYKLKFSLISVKENVYEIKCSYPEISPIQSSEISTATSVAKSTVLTSPQETSAKHNPDISYLQNSTSSQPLSTEIVIDSSNPQTTSSYTTQVVPVNPQSTPKSTSNREGGENSFDQRWLGLIALVPVAICGVFKARKLCSRGFGRGRGETNPELGIALVHARASDRLSARESEV